VFASTKQAGTRVSNSNHGSGRDRFAVLAMMIEESEGVAVGGDLVATKRQYGCAFC
jgi:hypothetical protein